MGQKVWGRIWKLLKLPYGITEAGRQWNTVIVDWLTTEMDMKTVTGLSRLLVKMRLDVSIQLLMEMVKDELLFVGTIPDMKELLRMI